jgi:hypothetical protein
MITLIQSILRKKRNFPQLSMSRILIVKMLQGIRIGSSTQITRICTTIVLVIEPGEILWKDRLEMSLMTPIERKKMNLKSPKLTMIDQELIEIIYQETIIIERDKILQKGKKIEFLIL